MSKVKRLSISDELKEEFYQAVAYHYMKIGPLEIPKAEHNHIQKLQDKLKEGFSSFVFTDKQLNTISKLVRQYRNYKTNEELKPFAKRLKKNLKNL